MLKNYAFWITLIAIIGLITNLLNSSPLIIILINIFCVIISIISLISNYELSKSFYDFIEDKIKRKIKMNKKIKDYIDKQFKEFKVSIDTSMDISKDYLCKKIENNSNNFNNQLKRFINKTNDSLVNHRLKINDLIDRDTYNREYIQALNFLSWFSWDKLHSKILAEEARNKLYSELKYSQIDTVYGNLTKLYKDNDNIDFEYITTGKYNNDNCSNLKTISIANSNLVVCCDNGACAISTNHKDEKIEEPPKPTYNDYVKAVVKTPHKFNKEIIYNVYKYLLEVIEKDKIASKYKV